MYSSICVFKLYTVLQYHNDVVPSIMSVLSEALWNANPLMQLSVLFCFQCVHLRCFESIKIERDFSHSENKCDTTKSCMRNSVVCA